MLFRNDLFLMNDATFRLLVIVPSTNVAWAIDVVDPSALPLRFNYSSIKQLPQLSAKGSANRVQSETASLRAQQTWSRIESLVTSPGIYNPSERNLAINIRARELGCSPQTLMKALRRYWQGGQTISALTGLFHLCGQVDEETPSRTRGRRPTYTDRPIYICSADDKKHMDEIIRKSYLKDTVVSVPAAYQRLQEKYYRYLDGNQILTFKKPGETPSLRQFRYYLQNNFSLEEIIRKRVGDKDFERDHRARLGAGMEDCHGIGHVYEIDATIADVFLVASKDRSRIIGKPTLYLIYDKYSRLVVGFYVGLEAPSWPAAMQAIVSIAEDKASLCSRYRVPYDPADWPAHACYPQSFLGDRGEMLAANSSMLSKNLQITVKNAPSKRPDNKGTVECGFKLIHHPMADAVPGYEPPSNVQKRRGKKYDKDACLTLDEFTAILLGAIISHNRSGMSGYDLAAELLSQGVRPIPRELWAADLLRSSGAIARYDEAFVRFNLLPQEKAVVTREGILFRNCYYTCPEGVKRGWFVKAGQKRYPIAVSYDRRLTDSVYISDKQSPSQFITAVLTPRSNDYRGLSFEEVAVYEYLRSALRNELPHTNLEERAKFHDVVDPISKSALREMHTVSKGKSRSSRKKDIKEDRLNERRERRQVEAAMPRTTPLPERPAEVLVFPSPPSHPRDKSVTPSQSTDCSGKPITLTLEERLLMQRKEMLND